MSADHNLSWRDERLKLSLNKLERLIGKTANQIALSGLIPRGRQLPNRLDPSGAVGRVRGKTQFWLRYKIWSILETYFFGTPFCFGAFGPDAGVQELMAIYVSNYVIAPWRHGTAARPSTRASLG